MLIWGANANIEARQDRLVEKTLKIELAQMVTFSKPAIARFSADCCRPSSQRPNSSIYSDIT